MNGPSGLSSKSNEKHATSINPLSGTSVPLAKESMELKQMLLKPKKDGEDHPAISETTNGASKAPSTTRSKKTTPGKSREQGSDQKKEAKPSLNSETSAPLKVNTSKSSTEFNSMQALSFKQATRPGHKPPKKASLATTGKDGGHGVQIESAVEGHFPSPEEDLCKNDQAQSHEEEQDERKDVPLELLAEFLQAVMTKNYPLAKKLCQMILIYEPQNSEAKSFLPLIEEKLLLEAENESDDDNDDVDDDEEEEEEDGENDDASSETSDTDEESSDSSDTLPSY